MPLTPVPISDSAPPVLLSIADVERETGLQKDTLRVWERRYGFPQPGRDANGDRVYDEAQLRRLLLIRRLLDGGARPNRVVALPEAELQRQLQALSPCMPAPAAGHDTWAPWLDAMKQPSPAVLHQRLRQYLIEHGPAATIEGLLGPLSGQVGEAWQRGELTVYQEHLYSEAATRLLREVLHTLDQPAPADTRPRVLLTTLPGEQHTLGLLMAECFFALEGCARITLGINTPLVDTVSAVRHYGADVLALSVSAHAPQRDAWSQLQQLRQLLPAEIPIWVGGQFTRTGRRRLPAGVQVINHHAGVQDALAQWRATPR